MGQRMMLQVTPRLSRRMMSFEEPPETQVGFLELIGAMLRFKSLILACVLVAMFIGGTYLLVAAPVYVAQTQVYIQPKRPPAGATQFGLYQLDSSQIESQIQLIKSERIARYVVRQLRLADDPEFFASVAAEERRRAAAINATPPATTNSKPDAALPADHSAAETFLVGRLAGSLNARRIGQSYVIEIAFSAHNPGTAVHVANAVTAGYIRSQVEERLDAAQRGAEFLETRINALHTDLAKLDAAAREGIIHLDTVPSAEGSVITSATLPLGKSWPKFALVLIFSGLVGTLVGLAWAGIRHATDNKIRSRKQIEQELRIPFLGFLPTLPRYRRFRGWSKLNIYTHIAAHPSSSFGCDVGCIKTELDIAMLESKIQCVGVISALAGEGTSTVASNLAHAMAAAGHKTLLVDCDTAGHSLSDAFSAHSRRGHHGSIGDSNNKAMRVKELRPNLFLLPTSSVTTHCNSQDVATTTKLQDILHELHHSYGLIVLDLPSMCRGADARSLSLLVDAIIAVAEHERTPRDALAEMIALLDRPTPKVLGVVINKFTK